MPRSLAELLKTASSSQATALQQLCPSWCRYTLQTCASWHPKQHCDITHTCKQHTYIVQALGLTQPQQGPAAQRPVVLVGSWEHHSNLLPWRESFAEVVTIRETAWSQPPAAGTDNSAACRGGQSGIDMQHLEEVLQKFSARGSSFIVGSFCAASNVTGVLCDMDAVSSKFHHSINLPDCTDIIYKACHLQEYCDI